MQSASWKFSSTTENHWFDKRAGWKYLSNVHSFKSNDNIYNNFIHGRFISDSRLNTTSMTSFVFSSRSFSPMYTILALAAIIGVTAVRAELRLVNVVRGKCDIIYARFPLTRHSSKIEMFRGTSTNFFASVDRDEMWNQLKNFIYRLSHLFLWFQIFRHGDRTPDATDDEKYPNDPYLNYSYYPMGRGQLTNVRISPFIFKFPFRFWTTLVSGNIFFLF